MSFGSTECMIPRPDRSESTESTEIEHSENSNWKFKKHRLILGIHFIINGLLISVPSAIFTYVFYFYSILQNWHDLMSLGLNLSVGFLLLVFGIISIAVFIKYSINSATGHVCFLYLLFLLAAIIPLEFTAVVYGKETAGNSSNLIERDLSHHFNQYNESDAQKFTDRIQIHFECCGISSPDDWKFQFDNNSLPKSCCENFEVPCNKSTLSHKKGCKQVLSSWSHDRLSWLCFCPMFGAFFQVLFIIDIVIKLYAMIIPKSPPVTALIE